MTVDRDSLNRTAKLFADDGTAASLDEAEAILGSFVLQLHVGNDVAGSRSRQAAILTIINTAVRAFRGGVHIKLATDPVLEVGWHHGLHLSEAIASYQGAIVVERLVPTHPTICVGGQLANGSVEGLPVLRATFDGWTCGVVEGLDTPLAENDAFTPAGVAAGAIAVGEVFEFRRGNPYAGRRSHGISLWQPDIDWLSPNARGPIATGFAPSQWWIVGLGHLGQGYLWSIGMLNYQTPNDVHIMMQDDDLITRSNYSTGLLLDGASIGHRKTRVLANVVDERGFETTITERRLRPGDGPTGSEPRLALIGVDNPQTRRELSATKGFAMIIDAGLGGGPQHYLDLQIHTFPSERNSHDVPGWHAAPTSRLDLLEQPAYREHADRAGDQCGTIDIAGRSVAAAFVGATAGALVVGEAFRAIISGAPRYSVIDASLRDLTTARAVPVTDAAPLANTGFGRLS